MGAGATLRASGARVRKHSSLLIACVIVALTLLRVIHLSADTPAGIGTESMGAYVDEGYKTLDPRNLMLFGSLKWHPDDDFSGFMRPRLEYATHHFSPVTQWPYYLSFRLFGQQISSVRAVTIALFPLLLLGFVYANAKQYSPGLLFAGLALLGLHSRLFFFSRIAVFVMPLVVCVCWLLFLLRRVQTTTPYRAIGLILLFAIIGTFGIKPLALIYIGPIALGFLVTRWAKGELKPIDGGLVIGGGVTVVGTAFLTHSIWQGRILYSELLPHYLLNPFLSGSALWVAGALLCILHILLTQPKEFLRDPYRAALVMMIILGPAILGLFRYSPLRYYVPLLPAYILLILEWYHLRMWRLAIPERLSWLARVCCPLVLIWLIFVVAQGFNVQVLMKSDFMLGIYPGLSDEFMLGRVAPLAALAGLLFWFFFRTTFFTGTRVGLLLTALMALSTVADAVEVGRFLSAPSYRSREISAELRRIVPHEASVAGDWAPFFAIGTDLKVLFMNGEINRPARLTTLRPDYYLYCDPGTARTLEPFVGVRVEPPIFVSSYMGREVRLHPLTYRASGEDGIEPPGTGMDSKSSGGQ